MAEDLNYYSTLIAVADDCPVTAAEVPRARGGKPTVAVLQYELISGAPYGLTQEDVLFETWLRRQDLPADLPGERRAELRKEFFSRSQACLRSSPLAKRYGWGLLFDRDGRIALCPMESEEYRRLVEGASHGAQAGAQAGADGGVRVLKAMRSRRS
ncbi:MULTISPECIES: DUF6157 family protein [Microbispora]|uniref:Uncharacterized protein n=1 Tax=Microbispora siamensis TaxID=564413 RepID=A0ABQ4GNI8_9ACTN|nr:MULTISPECIES: DUF6157 family protein [Microbispora]OPG03457.1 hypothetical protein B1L11_40280 [Microbispora sp. GKU 823]GIH62987.1 hypothetical protein Msi02_38040 [Microbispora siamensis]